MRNLRGVIPTHLRRRASALGELDRHLGECLPPDCREHCRVAAVAGDTLILLADSPGWRSRVHFLAPEIIRHFRRVAKPEIAHLRVRVDRTTVPLQRPRIPVMRALPSAADARALGALADDVDEPELAAALRRLARRGGDPDA